MSESQILLQNKKTHLNMQNVFACRCVGIQNIFQQTMLIDMRYKCEQWTMIKYPTEIIKKNNITLYERDD